MTTQTKANQAKPTTLTSVEGKYFPRVASMANKLYFGKDTLFFNIPEDFLKVVEIQDNEKSANEHFNTVGVFLTIKGVVHENVTMAAAWNIQASRDLTAEQRAGYMYNSQLNAFAFLRCGKIQMLPVNGRSVVDINGDVLFDLDEVLSNVDSLLDPATPEPKQPETNSQLQLNAVDDSWKNTENFDVVLLGKVIGPIATVYRADKFHITADQIDIDGYIVSCTSKDPLFACITETMHLTKIFNLLNENFAQGPGIGQLCVYDLYGGVSVITTGNYTALISTQLAKTLTQRKDNSQLLGAKPLNFNQPTATHATCASNPVLNTPFINLNHVDLMRMQAYSIPGSITLNSVLRAICINEHPVVGLEPTEQLLRTSLNEVPVVLSALSPNLNLVFVYGSDAYLYDIKNKLVHVNSASALFEMLGNIGMAPMPLVRAPVFSDINPCPGQGIDDTRRRGNKRPFSHLDSRAQYNNLHMEQLEQHNAPNSQFGHHANPNTSGLGRRLDQNDFFAERQQRAADSGVMSFGNQSLVGAPMRNPVLDPILNIIHTNQLHQSDLKLILTAIISKL